MNAWESSKVYFSDLGLHDETSLSWRDRQHRWEKTKSHHLGQSYLISKDATQVAFPLEGWGNGPCMLEQNELVAAPPYTNSTSESSRVRALTVGPPQLELIEELETMLKGLFSNRKTCMFFRWTTPTGARILHSKEQLIQHGSSLEIICNHWDGS